MRLVAITLALCLCAPALADARPITFGAGLGLTQSEIDTDGKPNDTLQLFGRVGLTSRLAAQLELQRIEDPVIDIRTATALLVVELSSSPRFVPLLVAGFGLDRGSGGWYDAEGTHTEGGFGLEYRAEGGLTVGADVRLGGRSIHQTSEILPATTGVSAVFAPTALVPGEYRSGRLYAGVRF